MPSKVRNCEDVLGSIGELFGEMVKDKEKLLNAEGGQSMLKREQQFESIVNILEVRLEFLAKFDKNVMRKTLF